MTTIVIEHVKIDELPEVCRAKLTLVPATTVTVRIEAEAQTTAQSKALLVDNPLFGMRRDREDMADVATYIRANRDARFNDYARWQD